MLGRLSSRYESSGDADAIGFDSTGGWSYGTYQIASKTGTLKKFLEWLSVVNPSAWASLHYDGGGVAAGLAGMDKFKNAWRGLCRADAAFAGNQHEFIGQTHYEVMHRRLLSMGFDVESRSAAMQDVVWSTSVQHGGGSDVVVKVLQQHGFLTDAELIPLIYAERGTRFKKSTPKVRAAVLNRFKDEQHRALAMLGNGDSGVSAPVPAPKQSNSASTVTQKPTFNTPKPNRSNYL